MGSSYSGTGSRLGCVTDRMATGVVKFFKEDKGWGAISSDALPADEDAFVHFSAIEADGYRSLNAGDVVEFTYEPAEQDSFRWIATSVCPVRQS